MTFVSFCRFRTSDDVHAGHSGDWLLERTRFLHECADFVFYVFYLYITNRFLLYCLFPFRPSGFIHLLRANVTRIRLHRTTVRYACTLYSICNRKRIYYGCK